jgi:hypothetical protein
MSIAINPVFPVVSAAQGAAVDVALQPGTTVEARVLKLLDANLVRIAIANLTIEVLSEVPLQPGTDVRLAVSQTTQGVRLQVVPQGAGATPSAPAQVADASAVDTVNVPQAAANAAAGRGLTNLEALAVSAAVQSAAARQGSLSPLFANLGVAATSAVLPQTLQQAAAQLLARRPSLDQTLTGADLKAAFKASGLFMEQAFAGAASQTPAAPDLKAALIVFRQTLATWLADAPAPEPSPTLPSSAAPSLAPAGSANPEIEEILLPQASVLVAKDAAGPDGKMRLYVPQEALPPGAGRVAADFASLQDVLQAFPKGVRDAVAQLLAADSRAAGAGAVAGDDGVALSNVPPPPFRGSAPAAQPMAAPSVVPDDAPATVVHRLIEDTDAALARQTLLQAASLPERVDAPGARTDPNAPRWHFEIPFATAQGTAVAQFEIARDGPGPETAAAQRVWRARFSLDVEPNGPVHALVTLSGGRTSVRMWAELPVTAARLRADVPQLAHALREAALEPGDIVIGDGAPPRAAAPAAGHFLDRAL